MGTPVGAPAVAVIVGANTVIASSSTTAKETLQGGHAGDAGAEEYYCHVL